MGNGNYASGNAQVGNQIGSIGGDYNAGPASFSRHEDLTVQLADLRSVMANVRACGRIDNASAEAISAELESAAKCLPIADGKSQNGFILAMKRAKGLADGLADVTLKMTAAIAAARGIM